MKKIFLVLLKPPLVGILFPLLVLMFIGFFLIIPLKVYFKEIINFFLLTLIVISIFLLLHKWFYKKCFFIFSTIVLHILAFIKISFYYNYAARLNASAFFIIFETNKQEVFGFLISYFNGFVISLVFLLIISLIFSLKLIIRKEKNIDFFTFIKSTRFSKIALIFSIFISIFLIQFKFNKYNLFLSSITAYKDYNFLKTQIKEELSQSQSKYVNATCSFNDFQTHIVIIGESTSRWHMQLYGYDRKTNPELDKIKSELLIFNDVIAPNVHTILSLDKILTFSNYNNPNKINNTSLVQLANEAGFETYWLSNQQAVGINEAISTQIGYAAKNKFFMAPDDFVSISYDEILLERFNEILLNKKSKVIFVHLMGTHEPYELRYPDAFICFKETERKKTFFSISKEEMINRYDNAIRYNDYIVGSMLNSVREMNIKSTLTYFSDHGDDVYDTNNDKFLRHNEYYATKPMYDIPFILWLSKTFRKDVQCDTLNTYVNRKYNLENYIHTFSDLLNINHDLFDPEKSLINEDYKEKIRLIQNNVDYDKKK